jgi:hypothetical protein
MRQTRSGAESTHCRGGYLIVEVQKSQMYELDSQGKVVWKYPKVPVVDALRLRNGNTLASGDGRLLEVTPEGKTVWEAFTDRQAMRLRRCLELVRVGFEIPRPDDLDLDTLESRILGLKSKDVKARIQSVKDLEKAGVKGIDAVPVLITPA